MAQKTEKFFFLLMKCDLHATMKKTQFLAHIVVLRGVFLKYCLLKTNLIARIDVRVYKIVACFFRTFLLVLFTGTNNAKNDKDLGQAINNPY